MAKSKTEELILSLKDEAIRVLGTYFDKHSGEIAKELDTGKVAKCTINFPLKIDLTQTTPQAELGCKFGKPVSDTTKMSVADPNQPSWAAIDDGGKSTKK